MSPSRTDLDSSAANRVALSCGVSCTSSCQSSLSVHSEHYSPSFSNFVSEIASSGWMLPFSMSSFCFVLMNSVDAPRSARNEPKRPRFDDGGPEPS